MGRRLMVKNSVNPAKRAVVGARNLRLVVRMLKILSGKERAAKRLLRKISAVRRLMVKNSVNPAKRAVVSARNLRLYSYTRSASQRLRLVRSVALAPQKLRLVEQTLTRPLAPWKL